MKYFVTTLGCPHCGGNNRIVSDPPRRYDKKTSTVKCWDAEEQKGCLKDFEFHQQIQCWATLTGEQLRLAYNEALNSDRSLADRMGV